MSTAAYNSRMVRPCYLVIDQEYAGSISTRKLVIETAKFNVLTAYSSAEAVATLRKYPAVDGIVLDAKMPDACSDLVRELKQLSPKIPLILVGSARSEFCEGADHTVDGFQPARLLELLQSLQPEQTAAVEKRNEELERAGS